MTPDHPENFDPDTAWPIDDEYIDEILNDEDGIPDGLEDVTPRVEIARKVYSLMRSSGMRGLSTQDVLTGLVELTRDENDEFDQFRAMQVVFRLSRLSESLLSVCRDFCTDDEVEEDDDDAVDVEVDTSAIDAFDELFFSMLDKEVGYLEDDKVTPYWDPSRARFSEGRHDAGATGTIGPDDEADFARTFRFSYTCDVDCDSTEVALVELADTVKHMLNPDSDAKAWTMVEYAEVVPEGVGGEVLSRRSVHLGSNSSRLNGFLGLLEQTTFVYGDPDA